MIEEVRVEVLDIDHEWFRDVRAFLDRASDLYYLPRESAERLGAIDEDTGDFFLIDGRVEARADEIEVAGVTVPVWTVACAQLRVRPAVKNPA